MAKKLLSTLLLIIACTCYAAAQEYFTISRYNINVRVNKDASLDIDEVIFVHFTEERHGIIRAIPYKYHLQDLPAGTEKAQRQLEFGDYTHTIIENISVDGWHYEVSNSGDYKNIKIGDADKYVKGDQQFVIHYRMLNAINFFDDFSELYFNLIGNQWSTTIDSINFSVVLYDRLPSVPEYFVATGRTGSKENNTKTGWENNQTLNGSTTRQLASYEGVTIGIRLPKDFLIKPDYRFRGIYWLLLPAVVFVLVFYAWRRWGKDDPVTVRTEYYPPPNMSPSVCGYLIDDRLNRRDLTALIPYWGAGGYLRIEETEDSSFFGLVKNTDYRFIRLKDLPSEAKGFERTFFYGLFSSGDQVLLSDLKNELYKTMFAAERSLHSEINKNDYYVKSSKTLGSLFIIAAIIFGVAAFRSFDGSFLENVWKIVALISSGLLMLIFGLFMTKKTKKGTEIYQHLLGFREFIRAVERDRLIEFLKQDEHYFDKILPYAIVFNVADTWKDKLRGIEVPPPTWYHGNYNNYSTANFMNSLNHSMNSMSSTFYSSPSGSGSSGGSFGGGGSSGGGFGGGGGSSW